MDPQSAPAPNSLPIPPTPPTLSPRKLPNGRLALFFLIFSIIIVAVFLFTLLKDHLPFTNLSKNSNQSHQSAPITGIDLAKRSVEFLAKRQKTDGTFEFYACSKDKQHPCQE